MYEVQNTIINDNVILSNINTSNINSSNINSLNENLLNERYDAIDKISTGIIQVNEIFTDLALLVSEQGSRLNNIEHNINNTATDIEKGKNVIVQIDKKDKKKGKCLCNTIYLCAIANCIFILILIIKITK